MNRREKEIDDAVEAMVMLSKQKTDSESTEITYAILRGDGWKEIINTTSFNINIPDKSIHFVYNEQEKTWCVFVIKGFIIVNSEKVVEGGKATLIDGAVVDVQKYSFVFVYGQRSKKFQKSYQKIITDAIKSSKENKMTLSQIYTYFIDVAGFSVADCTTWKNSIRHNLSLNKIFVKVPRSESEPTGKGAYWAINEKMLEKDKTRNILLFKDKTIEEQTTNNNTPAAVNTTVKKNKEITEQEEFQSKYIIFKKPSENVHLLNKPNRRKRKIKDHREDAKKYKVDYFCAEESSDSDKINLYEKDDKNETYKYKTIEKDVFTDNIHENNRIRRSQSIIELPDDLASLTLDTNKRSKNGGAK